MNTDLLIQVADHIESHPQNYNQDIYYSNDECGTVCCIAGFTVMFGDERAFKWWTGNKDEMSYLEYHRSMKRYKDTGWHQLARDLLDIHDGFADALFKGDGRPVEGLTVSKALKLFAQGAPLSEVWE